MNSTSQWTEENADKVDYFFLEILMGRIFAPISMMGSIYIIQDVIRDPRKRGESVYHRLMLGLSTCDIISSFLLFIVNSWALPKGFNELAVGSPFSCDVSAFFSNMALVAGPLYNCALTLFCIVKVKLNWTKSRIDDIEKWLHLVPLTAAAITSFAGLAAQTYGPFVHTCWITKAYPMDCIEPGSSIVCIRGGKKAHLFFWIFMAFLYFLSFLFVCIGMFKVYRAVLKLEKQCDRYSYLTIMSGKKNRKMSRRIMLQGILYGLALIMTYMLPATVFIIFILLDKQYLMVNTIIKNAFMPMQGFLNFLIYLLPTYIRVYQKYKERTRRRKAPEKRKNYLILDRSIVRPSSSFARNNHDDQKAASLSNSEQNIQENLPNDNSDLEQQIENMLKSDKQINNANKGEIAINMLTHSPKDEYCNCEIADDESKEEIVGNLEYLWESRQTKKRNSLVGFKKTHYIEKLIQEDG